MLDNGYSLAKYELLNWGNFQNLQVFDMRDCSMEHGLFSSPQASAILGVNGSGKSTLIDGLMICLLPFERQLKLGVTNDYEMGSSGGRSVNDYVLGKHSSGDLQDQKAEDVYGRKEGVSILLLHFQHNKNAKKKISIGRIWWYKKHRVQDNSLCFMALEDLSIKDLCPNGLSPQSPKDLKHFLKESRHSLQFYESVTAYFAALSAAFGGVKKEDLKLLNRAFYVKSISQIDSFIRQNMLVSEENPYLDNLLENVHNGGKIAAHIERCQKQVEKSSKILSEVELIEKNKAKAASLEERQKLLVLWPEHRQIEQRKKALVQAQEKKEQSQFELPRHQRNLSQLGAELDVLKTRLHQNESLSQIENLNLKIQHSQEELARVELDCERWNQELKEEQLKFSLDEIEKNQKVFKKLEEKSVRFSKALELNQQDYAVVFEKMALLNQEKNELEAEIDHLSKSKGLIPQALFSVKERALKELGLHMNHLMFFGELIQIKPEFKNHQVALEAVFSRVSQQLLCHPDSLKAFTSWLNKTGLRSTVTVKRIKEEELAEQEGETFSFSESQTEVLSQINFLSEDQHDFTFYLKRWCLAEFNYKIVDLKTFRSKRGLFVTPEGLLKLNEKTLKKLQDKSPPRLGWDNRLWLEERSLLLKKVKDKLESLQQKKKDSEKNQAQIQKRKSLCLRVLERKEDLLLLFNSAPLKEEIITFKESLKLLEEKSPELASLKQRHDEMALSLAKVQKKLASCEAEVDNAEAETLRIKKVLVQLDQSLKESAQFKELLTLKGEEETFNELDRLTAFMEAKGIDYKRLHEDYQKESYRISSKIESLSNNVTKLLTRFKSDDQVFEPNLSYNLKTTSKEDVEDFKKDWQAFRQRVIDTDLPQSQEKWMSFFNQVLIDSVKDTLNDFKTQEKKIKDNIKSINEVLKRTNFEDLPTEKRYLQIQMKASQDLRIRAFKRTLVKIESVLGADMRRASEGQSSLVIENLSPFVEKLNEEGAYRDFVMDVRNHYEFSVSSYKRIEGGLDLVVENFSGAKKDAKSSAQTTQLAYALLASSLSYRFHFHDPVKGNNSLRLIVLDEFGGKFDNEKPREIIKLLDKMGFQSVLVSPMAKAELLAESIGQLILVHKLSAQESLVQGYKISSVEEYHALLAEKTMSWERASAPSLSTGGPKIDS